MASIDIEENGIVSALRVSDFQSAKGVCMMRQQSRHIPLASECIKLGLLLLCTHLVACGDDTPSTPTDGMAETQSPGATTPMMAPGVVGGAPSISATPMMPMPAPNPPPSSGQPPADMNNPMNGSSVAVSFVPSPPTCPDSLPHNIATPFAICLASLAQAPLQPDTNPYLFYSIGASSTVLSAHGTELYAKSAMRWLTLSFRMQSVDSDS